MMPSAQANPPRPKGHAACQRPAARLRPSAAPAVRWAPNPPPKHTHTPPLALQVRVHPLDHHGGGHAGPGVPVVQRLDGDGGLLLAAQLEQAAALRVTEAPGRGRCGGPVCGSAAGWRAQLGAAAGAGAAARSAFGRGCARRRPPRTLLVGAPRKARKRLMLHTSPYSPNSAITSSSVAVLGTLAKKSCAPARGWVVGSAGRCTNAPAAGPGRKDALGGYACNRLAPSGCPRRSRAASSALLYDASTGPRPAPDPVRDASVCSADDV
jgi:hypothetical protein